ncbi:MAG: SpoIID/LytB domain-containing protein [Candidatus Planktophila sp.]|jgi:stage II sporulation protein D
MRILKRSVIALLPVLIIAIAPPPALASDATSKYTFSGSGYGHGVGMSQIGARAMALAGESATAILNYYYTGTAIETMTDTQILRVNIGHQLTSAKFRVNRSDAQVELFAGNLGETETAVTMASIPSKTPILLNILKSKIVVSYLGEASEVQLGLGSAFTLRWSGTRYLAGKTATVKLSANGTTNKYRYGQIQFKVVKDKLSGKRIEIINSVRLSDEYLWGVSEVPSSWPAAALQAQAIASRTYALSKAGKIRKACDCHLYAGINDQTFVGFAKESEPRFGIFWKSAIDLTASQVITFAGAPITAYFGSSTGGITETSENAWGTATAYTQSVLDSASVDATLNPRFAYWVRDLAISEIAAVFELPDVVDLKVLTLNPSGSVATISATSSAGEVAILRGETFRSRGKLPSAWFSINSS